MGDDGLDAPPRHEADVRAPTAGGYRIAPHPEVTAKNLEQELLNLKEARGELERELYAVRKLRRSQKALRAASFSGFGALGGSILGFLAYAAIADPKWIPIATVLGLFLGALIGATWTPPDDRFPSAPPPRMF